MFKKVLVAIAATAMVASATPVLPGSETSLQTIFNNATQGGVSSVNVATDQIEADKYWSIGSTTWGNATILVEIAGNANLNTFGIYDLSNTANKMQIFTGIEGSGEAVLLKYSSGTIKMYDADDLSLKGSIATPNYFGFYMGTPKGAFYSDFGLNGGDDHMVTYQGEMQNVKWPGQSEYAPWGAGEYVLAWEDLPLNGSDKDYNDMVVLVESIYPIPEPTMIGLLGLGLIGLVAYRRKK